MTTLLRLGEQRWRAVQGAADVWRDALEGRLPVVVHVTMADLPCGIIGAAQSGGYVTNVAGPNDDRVYSLALAENLSARPHNDKEEADIRLELNGANCPEGGCHWAPWIGAQLGQHRDGSGSGSGRRRWRW